MKPISSFRIFFLVCLVTLLPGRLEAQVSSTFDTGRDSWTVADIVPPLGNPPSVATVYTPDWSPAGGNPGGAISMNDPSGNWFFFSAPSSFLGDKSACYGGSFSYDLKCSPVSNLFEPGIVLVGQTGTLYYNTNSPPPGWSNYTAPLTPSSWRLNNYVSGPQPSVSEMKSVLSQLNAVYISGDRCDGTETAGLDNVRMTQPPQVVVLDWEQPVPRLIRTIDSRFGAAFVWTESGTMPPATTVPAAYKMEVRERVQRIFADSGVNNVSVTDTPTANATTVYFTDRMGDLQGYAWQGPDRFNRRPNDGVAVSLYPDPNRAVAELTAETVAHEVGHALGLRHVNPNPSADPANSEVMDDTYVAGISPRFVNAVSQITDLQSLLSDHNPVYHLKRYTDGVSHEELTAQGIEPGSWDRTLGERLFAHLDFGASARILHDVYVIAGESNDAGKALAHFETISLADLSEQEFAVDEGDGLQLVASSTPGGVTDVLLATGDPYDMGRRFVPVNDGSATAYLQAYSDSGAGYITLENVTVTGNVVPEPSTLALLGIGAVGLLAYAWRRRRN